MFDAYPETAIAAEAAAGWRGTLSPGAIVSFRFPVADGDGEPPKPRPCLVMEIVTIAGSRLVTLAYGTTAPGGPNRGYEIHVTYPDRHQAAGLHKATRFVGARRITVSADHAGFVVGPAGTPVLGRLAGREFERMNAVRARLQAEADIAAERRAERRRERERDRRTRAVARPPVEFRRPKRRALAPRPGRAA